jgi:hypothetical protein
VGEERSIVTTLTHTYTLTLVHPHPPFFKLIVTLSFAHSGTLKLKKQTALKIKYSEDKEFMARQKESVL